MRARQRRVHLSSHEVYQPGKNSGTIKLWAFGYATLADLFGVKEQTVRKWVCEGWLDPSDLKQVVKRKRSYQRGLKRQP